jgi:hypothetical protein
MAFPDFGRFGVTVVAALFGSPAGDLFSVTSSLCRMSAPAATRFRVGVSHLCVSATGGLGNW